MNLEAKNLSNTLRLRFFSVAKKGWPTIKQQKKTKKKKSKSKSKFKKKKKKKKKKKIKKKNKIKKKKKKKKKKPKTAEVKNKFWWNFLPSENCLEWHKQLKRLPVPPNMQKCNFRVLISTGKLAKISPSICDYTLEIWCSFNRNFQQRKRKTPIPTFASKQNVVAQTWNWPRFFCCCCLEISACVCVSRFLAESVQFLQIKEYTNKKPNKKTKDKMQKMRPAIPLFWAVGVRTDISCLKSLHRTITKGTL